MLKLLHNSYKENFKPDFVKPLGINATTEMYFFENKESYHNKNITCLHSSKISLPTSFLYSLRFEDRKLCKKIWMKPNYNIRGKNANFKKTCATLFAILTGRLDYEPYWAIEIQF
jgi:hypothetical protein